jgi:hypothetical protein
LLDVKQPQFIVPIAREHSMRSTPPHSARINMVVADAACQRR